jgi:hypothetical protein
VRLTGAGGGVGRGGGSYGLLEYSTSSYDTGIIHGLPRSAIHPPAVSPLAAIARGPGHYALAQYRNRREPGRASVHSCRPKPNT